MTAAILVAAIGSPASARSERVMVTVDRSQAEATLALLETLAAGDVPAEADWRRAFDTRGHRRLKAREEAMGGTFTEADFRTFVQAPETRARTAAWRRALATWTGDPGAAAADKAFAYLPPGTVLRATVFLTIKPKPNEFVFDIAGDPAVFLVLDPAIAPAVAANTMAHELHHIGMGAACATPASKRPAVAMLRPWIGAYAEGLAMLAAAGGPGVHPHATSTPAERAEWDANAARFAEQLREQNAYFRTVLNGTAGNATAVATRMRGYFGVQGPWYTVGWRMAQVIETELGRDTAVAAFCDTRRLLVTYNRAASARNRRGAARLPLWDTALATALAAD